MGRGLAICSANARGKMTHNTPETRKNVRVWAPASRNAIPRKTANEAKAVSATNTSGVNMLAVLSKYPSDCRNQSIKTVNARPVTRKVMARGRAFRCANLVQLRDTIIAIAGTAGSTYPGSFDCETEKNKIQNSTQLTRNPVPSLIFSWYARRAPMTAVHRRAAVHGRQAVRITGM